MSLLKKISLINKIDVVTNYPVTFELFLQKNSYTRACLPID